MRKLWISYNFIILFGIVCLIFTTILIDKDSIELEQYKLITIEEGENLWKIASEYSSHHDLPLVEFVNWVEMNNDILFTTMESIQHIYIPVIEERMDERETERFIQLAGK